MNKNHGFTLLEMMVAVTIFTLVMGTLLTLSLTFANTAELQELRITNNDEARRLFLAITPLIRQSSRNSINWDELPGDRITFQMATDNDGNGFAIDASGSIELTGQLAIERDRTDVNGDGITMSQLVLVDDTGNSRVFANGLQEEPAPSGAGEDIPDGVGFWIARQGAGVLITVRTEGVTRRGRVFTTTVSEFNSSEKQLRRSRHEKKILCDKKRCGDGAVNGAHFYFYHGVGAHFHDCTICATAVADGPL